MISKGLRKTNAKPSLQSRLKKFASRGVNGGIVGQFGAELTYNQQTGRQSQPLAGRWQVVTAGLGARKLFTFGFRACDYPRCVNPSSNNFRSLSPLSASVARIPSTIIYRKQSKY